MVWGFLILTAIVFPRQKTELDSEWQVGDERPTHLFSKHSSGIKQEE